MIVCQACGTSNADNERFCGQCGAFLEWEGAVVDRGGVSAPVEAPAGKADAGSAGRPDATVSAGAPTSGGSTGSTGASGAPTVEGGPADRTASGESPGGGAAGTTTVAGGVASAGKKSASTAFAGLRNRVSGAVTSKPASTKPATTGPATTDAAAAGSTTADAVAAGPPTDDVVAAGAATDQRATAKSATAQPATAKSTTAQPATATSATAQPATTQTTAMQPAGSGTADTEVQPGGLDEVQPGAPQRPRPVVTPPPSKREPPRPGDLICGQCGTGNAPTRRFCRSCGASLVAAVTAHVPWWVRLWRWLTRRNRYQAGQRRNRRVRPRIGRVIRLLIFVVVVALAVGFGPGLVRRVVNEVRDRTGDHVPLSPNGFASSSDRKGTPAQRIGDGATNRYWSPAGSGTNAWVEAQFGQPVRLLDIVVTSGISTRQDQFLTTGRPRELEVSTTPKSGKGKTFTLTLRDEPGAQTFPVEAENVMRVRLTVKSAYGPAAKAGVAVAEVEFFGRQ